MIKKLSIIIPVYNEEKTVTQVIKQVLNSDTKKLKKEIIIVDDSSTDNTKELLSKINDKRIKIFYHTKNKGKGSAIRTALNYTSGDLVLIQDADLEYDPSDYPKLIKPFEDDKVKVVYGSRYLKNYKTEYLMLHYIGNVFLTFFTNLLYGSKITDMETCYKMISSDVIKALNLKSNRFGIEPEITAKILKKGYKITEVPIRYKTRSFAQGKKITWKDGIKAFYLLIKYRFID